MVELFFFVLALLAGVALGWYLQLRYRQDEQTFNDAHYAAQLKQLQDEVRESDSALAETKERLIALQQEHQALQEELARLKRGDGAAGEPAAAAPQPPPAVTTAPSGSDDLTRIKGIGKVMEKKLQELGITSFRQLAELSPDEIRRINQAIEFPGRVERERWVEQARTLMSG